MNEDELEKAVDGIVEDYEIEAFQFDEKLLTRHIIQMAFGCVALTGLIVWLMETYHNA